MSATAAASLKRIAGFALADVVGQGTRSVVYRGVRDGQTYAVKLLQATQEVDGGAGLRFRREAAAVARLHHPGVVQVFEVGEHEGRPYLAMEWVAGEVLSHRLRRGPLAPAEVVRVARELARILADMHARGLVHGDLRPSHLVCQPDGAIKIIDFAFGRRGEEGQGAEGPQAEAQEAFLYRAPEQTGALPGPVDSRTDLYALGAVLYACATGHPPFPADSLPMLRQQQQAPLLQAHAENPHLSAALTDILRKLLALAPEERYQAAHGLRADFDRLEELEAAKRAGQSLALAVREDAVRREGEVALVGRAAEMEILQAAWRRACQGEGSLVQVEGDAGSGKTRLVRELMAWARTHGPAQVLAGKAHPADTLPFGVLREALDTYVASLARPGAEEGLALQAFRRAAGEFAGVVRRLSRTLEGVFASAPEVAPLDPVNEQLRFYDVVADFLVGLAREGGPTLLLVDDVQWLDDGSVEVLRRLARRLDTVPLLVACTARNDAASEVARHAFAEKLGEGLRHRLPLQPLDTSGVGQLLAAHLGGQPLEDSVVERLAARAQGNPFAVGEYLRALLEAGLVRPTAQGWVVDAEHGHALGLPHNVLQLLLHRLHGLGPEARRALGVGAVMGFEFATPLLADVLGLSPAQVAHALDEGLRAGLVEKADGHFRFVHDRVHEALLQGLSPEERRDTHQAVAAALERQKDTTPAAVHALAHHYAHGHVEKHPRRVFETSLQAGVHALQHYANEEAYALLHRALQFGTQVHAAPPSLANVHELVGVACNRTGRLEEAREHYQAALGVVKEQDDLARLYYLQGQNSAAEGRSFEAWDELQRALHMLGAGFPKGKLGQVMSLLRTWAAMLLRQWTGWGFGRAQGEERRHREAVAQILSTCIFLAYFLSDPLLMMQIIVRAVHNARFLGAHRDTAKAHTFYCTLVSMLGQPKTVEKHRQMALAMAHQLGDAETLAFVEAHSAVAVEIAGDNLRSQQLFQRAAVHVLKHGAAWDRAGHVAHAYISYSLQGRSRFVCEYILGHLPLLARSGAHHFHALAWAVLHSNLVLLGRTDDAQKAKAQALAILQLASSPIVSAAVESWLALAVLDREDFSPELEARLEAIRKLSQNDYHTRVGHLVVCYARLEQWRRASSQRERQQCRALLKAAIRRAGRPAPIARTPTHQSHLLVLRGALAREEGRSRAARQLFDRAQQLASQCESAWALWAVARERARLEAMLGFDEAKRKWADEAAHIAQREGWTNRLRQIEREFGGNAM